MNHNSDSLKILSELKFCVFDLETTGGNPENDQIIEIGLVRVENLKITEQQDFLINPKIKIPDFIQKLTGIKQDDIETCPEIHEVIDEILEFMGDAILVAHNTSFDIPFLNGVLKKIGKRKLNNKVICTNVMTKYLIPDILNSNLNYMCQLFQIKHDRAHRAIEDALATAKLLLRFLDIFAHKGIKKINQLYYPRNRFELDRIHIEHTHNHQEIIKLITAQTAPLIATFKGDKGILLATIPLDSLKSQLKIFSQFLKNQDWRVLTLKMIGPDIEGIIQLHQHFLKIPEANRNLILDSLTKQLPELTKQQKLEIQKYDFIISAHLISEQLIVYPIRSLLTKKSTIFKFPGHKKKFLTHLLNQGQQVKRNKKPLKQEHKIEELLTSYIYQVHLQMQKKEKIPHLLVSFDDIKANQRAFLQNCDKFLQRNLNFFNFPKNHL